MKKFMSWSGGKDAALALYNTIVHNQIECLLTNVSSIDNRISMHGVRRELLQIQAASIGIPLHTIELPENPSMIDYEDATQLKFNELKQQGFTTAIYGDIFLEDLKTYREQQLIKAGLKTEFPLWKRDTKELMQEFVQLGFNAIVVCTNDHFLDESFCGRLVDEEFINDLPAGVDPCGENGEYHTFVFDGPIFSRAIKYRKGHILRKEYPAPKTDDLTSSTKPISFSFCDLLPL